MLNISIVFVFSIISSEYLLVNYFPFPLDNEKTPFFWFLGVSLAIKLIFIPAENKIFWSEYVLDGKSLIARAMQNSYFAPVSFGINLAFVFFIALRYAGKI